MTEFNKPVKRNNAQLWQYASIGGQLFISLGIGVFLGLKADEWMNFKFPLLVWILPLLILIAMITRLIRATSKKNDQQ